MKTFLFLLCRGWSLVHFQMFFLLVQFIVYHCLIVFSIFPYNLLCLLKLVITYLTFIISNIIFKNKKSAHGSWLIHELLLTCSQLIHDLIITCAWLANDVYMNCSQLVKSIFTTCSQLDHGLFKGRVVGKQASK